ncbi:MAG TPA: hypothetical protein VI643_07760 [Planctomycetota bacterium]|nr:hypothetical protein [Planctomycetota bacterium]
MLLLSACGKGLVHTDSRGVTIVAGEPFFAVGLYHVPVADFEEVARAGFNVVTTPAMEGEPVKEEVMQALDAAAGNGLRIIAEFDIPEAKRCEFEAYKKHPGLLAWYIHEPESRVNDEALMSWTYRNVRRADPDHPIFLTIQDRMAYGAYGRFGHMIATEIFPVPAPSLHHVAAAVRAIQVDASKLAVWAVIQGHAVPPPMEVPGVVPRRPTGAEARCMAFLAVISGARGLMFWGYDRGNLKAESPALWEALGRLAKELRELSSVVLQKNSGMIEIGGVKAHAALKRIDMDWFLLYANPGSEGGPVELDMPYWPGPKQVRLDLKPYDAGCLKLQADGSLRPFPE